MFCRLAAKSYPVLVNSSVFENILTQVYVSCQEIFTLCEENNAFYACFFVGAPNNSWTFASNKSNVLEDTRTLERASLLYLGS